MIWLDFSKALGEQLRNPGLVTLKLVRAQLEILKLDDENRSGPLQPLANSEP